MKLREDIRKWRRKNTIGERIFDVFNFFFLLLIAFVSLFPFWQILAQSFNEPLDAMRGGIYFFPRIWDTVAYETVFKNEAIVNALLISILRTAIGTIVSITVTSLLAYALSKPFFKSRKILSIFCLITMFFSGGMIPTYITISELGLIDNFMVFILPSAVSVMNMIILKTFFENIPPAFEEAARVEGASWFRTFFTVVVPLAAPAIATVALFFAVGQWSAWFDAYIYILDADYLTPLQTLLMRIINQNTISGSDITGSNTGGTITVTPEAIKNATIIISTIPIFLITPFVQKYFVKGIMIGGVKE